MAEEGLLKTEKDYLIAHQEELAKKYPGRFVVIYGEQVIGGYDSYEEAVRTGQEFCGAGPFLVRNVHRPEEEETLTVPVIELGLL